MRCLRFLIKLAMLYLTSNGNFGKEVVLSTSTVEYSQSYRDAKNAKNNSASQISVDRVEYRKNKYKYRYCGKKHPPRRCPAFGKTCSTCKRRNHYAAVCFSSRYRRQEEIIYGTATSPNNNQYYEEQDSELDRIFLG